MKIIRNILLSLLILVIAISIVGYIWLSRTAPTYSGEMELTGLNESVDIYFDDYGIPHIYANNAEDAYFALGFVHAQERLFQMEMIRRVASGRMAELLGADLVGTDKFFRTMSIRKTAEKTANIHLGERNSPFQKAAHAYLDGINSFIASDNLPIEFKMLKFTPEKFTPADIYTNIGYTTLGFSNVVTQEPVMTRLFQRHGAQYIKELNIDPKHEAIDTLTTISQTIDLALNEMYAEAFELAPFPIRMGSNGWVVAPKKSASGNTILANDTHIFFAQPSVWYEAHLEFPGFSFSGLCLAGVPFGFVGHTRHHGWGLTIFPIDNMDMYFEQPNPENRNEVWAVDEWIPLEERSETIKIKDNDPIDFTIQSSRHGPILNGVVDDSTFWKTPVAIRWVNNEFETKVLHAAYRLNYAQSIDDAREAAQLIDVLGLNVLYGDASGNIALWSSGKISKRPGHVNSKLILDGASGKDDLLGYYDFSENPQAENPENGYLYTANQQPEAVNGFIYPGHYTPISRANRIDRLLAGKEKWSLEDFQEMHQDVVSDTESDLAKHMLTVIEPAEGNAKAAYDILNNWDGDHQVDAVAPTIYNKLLYNALKGCMEDEMGTADFNAVVSGYEIKRAYLVLFKNDTSAWWDDVNTEVVENRNDIFQAAFDSGIRQLEAQFGTDVNEWRWGQIHTLEHGHPIGRKKPFDKVFNVGPFEMPGSNAVMNKMGFAFNEEGDYKVFLGPAIRMIVDFADVENGVNILPTGQSGNVMSPHYKDQAEMFNAGEYRKQMMNKDEIMQSERVLRLNPANYYYTPNL